MSLFHSLFAPVSVTHQEHINHVCPAQTAAQIEAAATSTLGMDTNPAGCRGHTSQLKRALRGQKLLREKKKNGKEEEVREDRVTE